MELSGEKKGGAGGITGSCHSQRGRKESGGLGNVNKGKLKNGREDSQVSCSARGTADWSQPVCLISRLSWAREGALDADPSRSIRPTCLGRPRAL